MTQRMKIKKMTKQGGVYYQQSPEALDVTKRQGDVDEHNDVADYYGADVTVALPVDLIFDTPLRSKGDGQVWVAEALQEADKSEIQNRKICTHTDNMMNSDQATTPYLLDKLKLPITAEIKTTL